MVSRSDSLSPLQAEQHHSRCDNSHGVYQLVMMLHHYKFILWYLCVYISLSSRCFNTIIINTIIIHKTHQAIARIKSFESLPFIPRVFSQIITEYHQVAVGKTALDIGNRLVAMDGMAMLGGVFPHFAGVLNFSWALLEAKEDFGAPQKSPLFFSFGTVQKCHQKAIQFRNLHSNSAEVFLKKNTLLHSTQAGFFFGPDPRKADRFKTIPDDPKVLTLTPSTF